MAIRWAPRLPDCASDGCNFMITRRLRVGPVAIRCDLTPRCNVGLVSAEDHDWTMQVVQRAAPSPVDREGQLRGAIPGSIWPAAVRRGNLQKRPSVPPRGDERTKRSEQIRHRLVAGHRGEASREQPLWRNGIGEEEQRKEDHVACIDGGGAAGPQCDGAGEACERQAPKGREPQRPSAHRARHRRARNLHGASRIIPGRDTITHRRLEAVRAPFLRPFRLTPRSADPRSHIVGRGSSRPPGRTGVLPSRQRRRPTTPLGFHAVLVSMG